MHILNDLQFYGGMILLVGCVIIIITDMFVIAKLKSDKEGITAMARHYWNEIQVLRACIDNIKEHGISGK
jgi:hypothetical protein